MSSASNIYRNQRIDKILSNILWQLFTGNPNLINKFSLHFLHINYREYHGYSKAICKTINFIIILINKDYYHNNI